MAEIEEVVGKVKRIRRDKRTVIVEKIDKLVEKIAKAEEKLSELKDEKKALDDELFAIDNAEAIKAKEEEQKKVMAFIAKNGITLEQLEEMMK